MARPSDPLLSWLRAQIQSRGLNTARVAEAIGASRVHARKVLAGEEPMTVDELVAVGKVLDLQPGDVNLVGMPTTTDVVEALPDAPVPDGLRVDPLGNHPEQIFRFGFALGCDFFFLAKTSELEASGVPRAVLAQYKEAEVPIKLDAAYHGYNDPRYDPSGITLTLSFDALYECRFPWTAITRVIFFPEPPSERPEVKEEGEPPKPSRPTLRLVT